HPVRRRWLPLRGRPGRGGPRGRRRWSRARRAQAGRRCGPGGDVPPADLRRRPREHHRARSAGMNVAAPHGTVAPGTLDLTADKPVPFTRLVKVELRKMLDTRAGMWLLIAIALLTGLVLVIFLINADDKSFINAIQAS